MLRKLWIYVREQLVAEVPDEMSACLDCGAIQCLAGKFDNCPTRLARAAALQAMRPVSEPEIAPGP